MIVAGMIIRCVTRWIISGERINPTTRTNAVLPSIQPCAVCIGATGAKMIAAYPVAAEAAGVRGCRCKRVLAPGLAELFESLGVVSATTHSIKILWNEGMVIAWQSNPIDVHCTFVTSVSSQSQANEAVDRTIFILNEVKQLTHDDIGAGNSANGRHHRWADHDRPHGST